MLSARAKSVERPIFIVGVCVYVRVNGGGIERLVTS
jgi:hypothetical protein